MVGNMCEINLQGTWKYCRARLEAGGQLAAFRSVGREWRWLNGDDGNSGWRTCLWRSKTIFVKSNRYNRMTQMLVANKVWAVL